MLALPRLPVAFEDEIVGTFLGRITEENSLGSPHVLLTWLGASKYQRNSLHMDVSVLTPKWVNLANRIGLDIAYIVDVLSTKPYWAFFTTPCAVATQCKDQETPRVPAFVLSRASRIRAELRVCTACLREAKHAGRAPYALRSHQLPGSNICFKHRTPLIHRCPACNRVLLSSLGPLNLGFACECGTDLSIERDVVSKNDPFYRLACLEHECLTTNLPRVSALQATRLIRRECRARGDSVESLLHKCFGKPSHDWRMVEPNAPPIGRVLRSRTPEICVYLTSLGLDLSSACEAISSMPEPDEPVPRRRKPTMPDSTSEARKELLAMKSLDSGIKWKAVRTHSRFVFWRLFLQDQAWLGEQLVGGRSARLSVPSLAEDRVTIAGVSRSRYRLDQATARAWCRDRRWLNSFRERARSARADARDRALVKLIRTQMDLTFCREGRPEKFGLREAATATGLSPSGVLNLCRRVRAFEHALCESALHYRLRLLTWALQEMHEVGTYISPFRLIRKAGLEPQPINRFLAASVIYVQVDPADLPSSGSRA